MSIIFSSRKQVSEVKREKRLGSFSIASDPLTWVGCRDHFLTVFHAETPGFFFTVPTGEHERVPAFVLRTEEILDIQGKGFPSSRFALTNRSYVLWIDPSMFWRESEMKRSFFSALVRAGLEYLPEYNNYEEALYKKRYFRETKSATIRFLFGHTEFTSSGHVPRTASRRGWHNTFSREDDRVVRKKLVTPEDEEKRTSLIGAGSLWR